MSDIHGCLAEFEMALLLVLKHMEKDPDTKLILLGDYIHGGPDGRGVMDKIMELQHQYGNDRVIAILGNHDESVLEGIGGIDNTDSKDHANDWKPEKDDSYIRWLSKLPRYHVEGKTIFTHAGIDEEAGDLWEIGTGDHIFTGKYPAQTGPIPDLDMKIVAGHIGTASISGNPDFHCIYYDGASHYYIDGTVLDSGRIPVLMVDTKTDMYYSVTEKGNRVVRVYEGSKKEK